MNILTIIQMSYLMYDPRTYHSSYSPKLLYWMLSIGLKTRKSILSKTPLGSLLHCSPEPLADGEGASCSPPKNSTHTLVHSVHPHF